LKCDLKRNIKEKRIADKGAACFIESVLRDRLLEQGAEVIDI